MSPTDVVITALIALRSNILRTLLTMLGIIIGISAVIALTAAGQGAQKGVADRIKGLGSNLMFIQPGNGKTTTGLVLPGQGNTALFLDDARAIDAAQIDGVDAVAAQGTAPAPAMPFGATAIYRGQNISTTLIGTETSYQYVRDFYVAEGRFITEDDINKKALVVVLGAKVKQQLFGDKDPIGENVRLTVGPGNFAVGFSFTVVGVMEEKGSTSSTDQDNVVITPLPSFQARVPLVRNPRGTTVSQVNIKVTDGSKIPQIKLAITDILRERHNLAEGTDNDFLIQSQSDVLSTATDGRPHPQRAARVDRTDLADRRRHRHHEHHARVGERAHARDWHPQGGRGEAPRHPPAIHHRSAGRNDVRGPVGRCRGRRHHADPAARLQLPHQSAHHDIQCQRERRRVRHHTAVDPRGSRDVCCDRAGLRRLPRLARRETRPDRGAPARVSVNFPTAPGFHSPRSR